MCYSKFRNKEGERERQRAMCTVYAYNTTQPPHQQTNDRTDEEKEILYICVCILMYYDRRFIYLYI